jgi:hypothetical protein
MVKRESERALWAGGRLTRRVFPRKADSLHAPFTSRYVALALASIVNDVSISLVLVARDASEYSLPLTATGTAMTSVASPAPSRPTSIPSSPSTKTAEEPVKDVPEIAPVEPQDQEQLKR